MSFELKPEIRKALRKIRFVDRFEEISERSRKTASARINKENRFEASIEQATNIIESLGYEAIYNKKEKFLKVGLIESLPTYRIWFNMDLRFGIAELIWVVYYNGEVRLGSPWDVYPELLIGPEKKIKLPVYSSYSELEQILKAAFELYEEFKQAIIEEYQPIQTVLTGETPIPTP